MAHPLQELRVTDGKVIAAISVEQVKGLLTELDYRVVTEQEWHQVSEVIRCARAVSSLRNNGEASTKANDELAYAIDQLDDG